MKFLKRFCVIGSLLFSTSAFAVGGWTSGGGELIQDSQNPWFLSNTNSVNYCLIVNEAEFGQSERFVREQVRNAISFWKRQLADLKFADPTWWGLVDGPDFRIGTQVFYESGCDKADIKFQFGFLTAEQEAHLGDTSKIVAVSVRTNYDKQKLRGKGFVFLNRNSVFPILPWSRSEGSRVLPVLIHELGHVFGIHHNNKLSIMQDDFAERLVEQKESEIYDRWTKYFSFNKGWTETSLFVLNPQKFPVACPQDGVQLPKPILKMANRSSQQLGSKAKLKSNIAQEFFGIPRDSNCSYPIFEESKFQIVFYVDHVAKILGEASLERVPSDMFFDAKSETIIQFWLPKEQQLFCSSTQYNCENAQYFSKLPMASYEFSHRYKGVYKSLDHKINRPIAIEVDNGGYPLTIAGELKGEVYLNLFWGY